MKHLVTKLALPTIVAVAATISINANAAPIVADFGRITSNNVENVASQLHANIYSYSDANATYGSSIAPASLAANQILVTFTNNVGTASSISEVYIDDDLPIFASPTPVPTVYNSLGGGTNNFTNFAANGSTDPNNVPGGASTDPAFIATTSLSADVASGPPTNGVNTAQDILGIVYTLVDGKTFADVAQAFANGDFRFALHVRSIGVAGGSDSFVSTNNPVPEPSSLALLALGLAGVGFSRRMARK